MWRVLLGTTGWDQSFLPGSKVAEDVEFVHNEPSLAVIGGGLENSELLFSASGSMVKKSDMRVGALISTTPKLTN